MQIYFYFILYGKIDHTYVKNESQTSNTMIEITTLVFVIHEIIYVYKIYGILRDSVVTYVEIKHYLIVNTG